MSWGGKQPGAGRPKGALSKTTIEQKVIKNEIHRRVLRSRGRLINSQFNLAVGCSYLYKKAKIGSSTPLLVKDPLEIEKYLAGEFEEGASDYYFITTDKPDIRALQDFWDRVIGKPATVLEGGDEDKPLLIKLDDDERKRLANSLGKIIGIIGGQE